MTGLPVVQEDILHLFSSETMTLATVDFSYLKLAREKIKVIAQFYQVYRTC